MRLNPMEVLKDFEDGYLGYLETHLSTRYDYLNQKIEEKKKEEGNFIKGPYLQLTPPYEKGATISDLVEEGVLHPDILTIFGDVQLYSHQEKTIRNVVQNKRNAFIATGTGSGKTYSFLIPVVDYILKNQDKKGVKALFMYPMNALANDQINTLRNLIIKARQKGLKAKITFGKYTGETPENYRDYLKKTGRDYKKDKAECPDQLLTRQEILGTPPDILITNYSMLEFLLLRPKDTSLFNDYNYKFIVIDEIHVYDGAKGTEIGYLLRKLKARAFPNPIPGSATCIGASATIGEINDENLKKAANFATDIFGEPFDKSDVITSTTIELTPDSKDDLWFEDLDFDEILKKAEDVEKLKKYLSSLSVPGSATGEEVGEVLFNFFKNYEYVYYLLNKLKDGPVLLQDILKEEGNKIKDMNKLIALISLLFLAKNKEGIRLLDARYHIFLKGIEGVYSSLNDPGNKEVFRNVYMEKKIRDISSEDERAVFQLCSCSNCGEVFITGYETPFPSENSSILEIDPSLFADPFKIDLYKRTFVYIPHLHENYSLEEDIGESIWLDPVTGKIYNKKPDDDIVPTWDAIRLNIDDELNQPEECPNCGMKSREAGGKNYWITYFTPEPEYPQANILEILYRKVALSARKNVDKKVLVFSDSRKDAAFFAPFFERYYENRTLRWVMYNSLKEIKDAKFDGLVSRSANCIGDRSKDLDFIEKLLGEFAMMYTDSLEKVGLAKFYLNPEISDKIISKLSSLEGLNSLSKEELNALLHYLLKDSRSLRHVMHPDFSKEKIDEIHSLAYVWKEKPSGKRSVTSWLPKSRGKSKKTPENKRTKLLQKVIPGLTPENAYNLLSEIWDILVDNEIFEFKRDKGYQINAEKWNIKLIDESKGDKIYRCNVCRKVHLWNVKDVCRDGNCPGQLKEGALGDVIEARGILGHFKEIKCKGFKDMDMKISEHTAQLSTEEGQRIQRDFEQGKINILSCSTTFELGVDLGELEVVFLHNIPPRPDNYVQRAGRAGRSADSVALVCSYALNRPLDLKAFNNPVDMIKGSIRPPVVKVTNSLIILRHLNSIALSEFLRFKYPGAPKISIGKFYEDGGFEEFKEFMADHYDDKVKPIIDIVLTVPDLRKEFGVDTGEWWSGNISLIEEKNSETFLEQIKKEFEEDIKPLEDKIRDLKDKIKDIEGKRSKNKALSYELNNYESLLYQKRNEDLISFFSKKVFIPKYGFPVDVVSLDVLDQNLYGKVQLDRDLGIAIGEYAPLESVIALGHEILSTQVKMYRSLRPEVRRYLYCKSCLSFNDAPEHDKDFGVGIEECSNCGSSELESGKYLIPKYGFDNLNIFKYLTGKDYNKNEIESIKKRFKLGRGVSKKATLLGKRFTGSKLRSFYKGITSEKIKDTKEYKNGIRTTPYKRGEIVVLNVSEKKKVSIDRGINISLYSEDKRNELRNEDRIANLGYKFYTDVLIVELDDYLVNILNGIANTSAALSSFTHIEEKLFAVYTSVLYALIEGASKSLEIKRDDIDGALKRNVDKYDFVLYDNVPGGAGFVLEIHDNFDKVLEAAYDISAKCGCDEESACSICLLHTRNQIFSKFIKRAIPAEFLGGVLGK